MRAKRRMILTAGFLVLALCASPVRGEQPAASGSQKDSAGKTKVTRPSAIITQTTTQVTSFDARGNPSWGTGFFYQFDKHGNQSKPAVVTNYHVVEGSVSTRIVMRVTGSDGEPVPGKRIEVNLPGGSKWIRHPDRDVDLAVIPIADALNQIATKGIKSHLKALDESLIPAAATFSEIGPIEEIVMLGHPIGLWDWTNMLPLARRGITATHAGKDFQGRKEFVIDAACFPGSSGSPVFLVNEGYRIRPDGGMAIGHSRVLFLGILYAGPMYDAAGEVLPTPIATTKSNTSTQVPANLGYVIQSERLKDFERFFKSTAPGGIRPSAE